MSDQLFAGSIEPEAIVVGSPYGMVRYRGVPPFTEEDARLFAAAPDLLAALKHITERFHSCLVTEGLDEARADAVCAKANAAIAKAEGRS